MRDAEIEATPVRAVAGHLLDIHARLLERMPALLGVGESAWHAYLGVGPEVWYHILIGNKLVRQEPALPQRLADVLDLVRVARFHGAQNTRAINRWLHAPGDGATQQSLWERFCQGRTARQQLLRELGVHNPAEQASQEWSSQDDEDDPPPLSIDSFQQRKGTRVRMKGLDPSALQLMERLQEFPWMQRQALARIIARISPRIEDVPVDALNQVLKDARAVDRWMERAFADRGEGCQWMLQPATEFGTSPLEAFVERPSRRHEIIACLRDRAGRSDSGLPRDIIPSVQ